jgi:hypothetical protein
VRACHGTITGRLRLPSDLYGIGRDVAVQLVDRSGLAAGGFEAKRIGNQRHDQWDADGGGRLQLHGARDG